MSQETRELSARFSHLLQPIRDLTKNWDIDVAAQLEEYLEEIEHITITFDGQNATMNFAEAALLIQGSTCVYSKKVEYLYSLVYQTLDLIASKKKLSQSSSVDAHGKDRDVSFAQKNDEFLSLNMEEAHNIDMDERPDRGLKSSTCQVVPRTPMSLIPLQDTERATSTPLLSRKGEVLGSRVDFMMNTGAMHSSGALLLEPVNHLMLTAKVTDRGDRGDPISLHYQNTPLNKIREMLDSDRKVPSMAGDDDAHLFEDDDYGSDSVGGVADNDGGGHDTCKTSPRKKLRNGPMRVSIQEEQRVDPWSLLDPHEKSATDNKPMRKGVTYKVLSCLAKNEGRKRKKKSGPSAVTPAESLTSFLWRTVYSCSSIFPKNPLKAPSSSEFEGYYWAEAKKRLKQKKQENLKLVQLHRDHALQLEQQTLKEEDQDNLDNYQPLGGYDDDDEVGGLGGSGLLANMEAGFQGALDNYAQGAGSGRVPDLQELAVSAGLGGSTFQGVEPMALDELSGSVGERGPLTYEDLVKNYVEGTMDGVQTYMEETDLTKRVEQWEEKIRPVLAVEEEYPMFDIHAYGSTVIQELQQNDNERILKFKDLASNKKHYDVSRLFAASLQLANNYNLEITSEGVGEDAVGTMSLTLLNPQLMHTKLSDYKAPSLLSEK